MKLSTNHYLEEKLNIVVIQNTLEHPSLDKKVKEEFLILINKLESSGHKINFKTLPLLDYLVPAYYILTTAEASSNLARYDGVKYGYRSKGASTLTDLIKSSRSKGFGPEVKRRILLGSFVLRLISEC